MTDTALRFHQLSYLPEGDDVVVGRPDIDEFVVLPPDAVEALHQLERGMRPSEVATWYRDRYDEDIDIDDYVDTLVQLQFVRLDGIDATITEPVRFRRLGAVLLGPPALVAYALLCAWAAFVMTRHPYVAPRPDHVFFVSSISVVEIVAVVSQLPLLLAHESYHALAGRRLGLPSKLGVTRRLYFFVFETRLSGLMSVPRGKRYLCFLAGIILDLVFISGLSLTGYFLHGADGIAGLVGRLALSMAFPVTVRVAYQFVLFLQTDLYYVAATAAGSYDLHGASQAVLADWKARLRKRPDLRPDLDAWTPTDLARAAWWAPFFALGSVVLVAVWLLAFVPVLWMFGRDIWSTMSSGVLDARFADRAVFVLLNIAEISLMGWISARDRRTVSTVTPSTRQGVLAS